MLKPGRLKEIKEETGKGEDPGNDGKMK